ncbi:MAG: hypothetical protein WBZ57_25020 [Pseudomonas graminis]
MDLTLRNSRGRKLFKRLVGQNNHFLITILVGLDSVEQGAAALSEDFHTSWSPKDVQASSRRSREFAIKATLIWICDALDAYLRTGTEHPCLFSPKLMGELADARQQDRTSISDRLQIVAKNAGAYGTNAYHLAQVAIVWRNRVTHYRAKNRVAQADVAALTKNAESIRNEYQGLDVVRIIDHANKKEPEAPTFKEITSLLRAVHCLFEEIDKSLIGTLDMDDYLEQVVAEYVRSEDIADDAKRPAVRARRIHNIWGKQDATKVSGRDHIYPSRRVGAVWQVALNGGMTETLGGEPHRTTAAKVAELAAMDPVQAAKLFS